jgi:hypothetical protein
MRASLFNLNKVIILLIFIFSLLLAPIADSQSSDPPAPPLPPDLPDLLPAILDMSEGGQKPAGTTGLKLVFKTSQDTICRASTEKNIDFSKMPIVISKSFAMSHSYEFKELVNGSSYIYYIRCKNQIGLMNYPDRIFEFSVAKPTSSGGGGSGGGGSSAPSPNPSPPSSFTPSSPNSPAATIPRQNHPSEVQNPQKLPNLENPPHAITTLIGQPSSVVEAVSLSEAEVIKNYGKNVDLNEATGKLYLAITGQSQADLSTNEKQAIAYFIHYGTATTNILGAGERAGVLNSYFSVYGKLPRGREEWKDAIKIANGRWPSERRESAEKKAESEIFKYIYKRPANMNNPNDNAAVTVITYGLRPANRNLNSEKAAVNIFKGIYKRDPRSALDWDTVRAIAYSGAVR